MIDQSVDLKFMIVCECIAFYFFDGHIFSYFDFFSLCV